MSKHPKSSAASQTSRPHCPCLEFLHGAAKEVYVAGTFNDWHPTATPMAALGDGRWAKELALPPGRYEYRFVVDGEWVDDPTAAESVPNPFGGLNAVLIITEPAGEKEASSPSKAKPRSSRRST